MPETMHVFDFKDMPSEIRAAYRREVPWYNNTDKDYIEWDMAQSHVASNHYIKVNNWLIEQTDDNIKQVLIKL